MAATSPYSPNDYAAVDNFRPYNLPINDIFKAISAQNEFWDAGARRVKAVYDNALNLDLTIDANKEVKKKFMEDADKQLTKLSSMDLSDPSIQRQGFNIYKPLLQDKAIMYDSEITKTLKGVYGDANSYRKRKLSTTGREGEGYTDRNLAYSLDGFEQFHSKLARDPEMLKGLYDKLGNRKYTPYYDPTKEYAGVLKNCKGSAAEKQDVAGNYMYFDNSSKSGANSSETANCFMMGLSEQAKQQIGIDGWAYYKGNPALLAKDHKDFVIGKQEKELSALKGSIAGIKGADQSKLTQKEKDYIAKVEKELLPQMQSDYDTRLREFNNMTGGDGVKYVTDNFQTLSKGIYLNKTYGYLGEAYKSDENIHKLTANAAGIAQFNAIERSYQDARRNEYEKEQIRLRGSIATKIKQQEGLIPLDDVDAYHPDVTDNPIAYGENAFNRDYEMAKGQLDSAAASLSGYIKSTNPDSTVPVTDEYILNYTQEQEKKPLDQRDKQYVERMAVFNATKDMFTNMDIKKKTIEALVKDEFGYSTKKVKIGDREVTMDELSRIRNGESINGITYKASEAGGGGLNYTPSSKGSRYYMVDGKKIDSGFAADDRFEEETGKMTKRRNELYNKGYFDAQGFLSARINPEKYNDGAIGDRIRTILGVSGKNNEKNGYKLVGHDRTGRDLLVVRLDENGNEVGTDLQRARSVETGVTEQKIGTSVAALRIPNVLENLPDVPSPQDQQKINYLRDFKTLMEQQMINKGGYFSSENLKNKDGTTFPYTTFTFKTEGGANVKVKAVSSNGGTQLVPARQLPDGTWDTNYRSFSTPEELIIYFSNKK